MLKLVDDKVMIDAVKLSKSFRGRTVLDELSLQVMKGETLVIIGRSGCGKSVFLKHAMGIVKPDRGEISIDGLHLSGLSKKQLMRLRMRFGMLFQNSALFDSMTVGENVAFALHEHSKMTAHDIEARVAESLEMVDLRGIQHLKPSELSGGMRKRVALARAIAFRPEILLYDEPTTGLDPITSDAINDLIRLLHDRLKVTSIVVTHDMTSAYKVGSRIAMMYLGKILQVGTPDEIRGTTDPVVRQFITGSAQGPITDAQGRTGMNGGKRT